MKQITITVPDNCELKQNGNTYIIVEKEKKLTYEDVVKKLFHKDYNYFIDSKGIIINTKIYEDSYEDANNCTSKKQAEKLLAINKLMNVAKYLNGDWQVNWKCDDIKGYYIYYSHNYNKLIIIDNESMQELNVYFKSEELAQQAIEILGEETIKLALCTDY